MAHTRAFICIEYEDITDSIGKENVLNNKSSEEMQDPKQMKYYLRRSLRNLVRMWSWSNYIMVISISSLQLWGWREQRRGRLHEFGDDVCNGLRIDGECLEIEIVD